MTFSTKLAVIVTSSALTLMASSASAVTMHFGGGPDNLSTVDFGDFTVTASATSGSPKVYQRGGYGLGVKGSVFDSSQIDGWGPNETLTFAFDFLVNLTKIDFSSLGSNDDYTLSFDGGAGSTHDVDPWTGSQLTSSFSLSALGYNDDFYVKSISYDQAIAPIPLPASGLLLLSALGGLGIARRRRRK